MSLLCGQPSIDGGFRSQQIDTDSAGGLRGAVFHSAGLVALFARPAACLVCPWK